MIRKTLCSLNIIRVTQGTYLVAAAALESGRAGGPGRGHLHSVRRIRRYTTCSFRE